MPFILHDENFGSLKNPEHGKNLLTSPLFFKMVAGLQTQKRLRDLAVLRKASFFGGGGSIFGRAFFWRGEGGIIIFKRDSSLCYLHFVQVCLVSMP